MKKYLLQTLFLSFFLTTSITVFAQDVISIAQAREVDAEGSLVRLNQNVELTGIAIGPNFRGGGQTWALFDVTDNIGITVFAFNNDVGYDVTDGDELRVVGDLDEFNGLAEIIPTSITIVSQGNSIPDPEIVTDLSEQTEAKLVSIENVTLVDPSQWGSGSFNVDMATGTTTFQVRIDSDINISGMPVPTGTFTISGIGGQFDNEAPYAQGYQLFPRSTADINPYNTGAGPTYEKVSLEEARAVDSDFALALDDERVEVSGVTHGINFRPGGLQFTMINENNVGLGVFSSGDMGYTFAEGDDITIWGRLTQFNGLAQINPDSLVVNSSGNATVTPNFTNMLDESTESSLTTVTVQDWEDPAEWRGDGSSWNMIGLTPTGERLTIRIDNDTELASAPYPGGQLFITGIGGQFDNEAPFDEGYQLIPRTLDDFEIYLSNENVYAGQIEVFPNPAKDLINITSDDAFEYLNIINVQGQVIKTVANNTDRISTENLTNGLYILKVFFDDAVHTQKILIGK